MQSEVIIQNKYGKILPKPVECLFRKLKRQSEASRNVHAL